MKRTDLLKALSKAGYSLLRNGANHDIYSNGKHKVAVPRHRELKERTARGILKEAGIE